VLWPRGIRVARLQPSRPAIPPRDEGNRSEEPSPEEQGRGCLQLGGHALDEIPASEVNWRCLDALLANIQKAKQRAVSPGHIQRQDCRGAPLRAAALGYGCVSSGNQFTLATLRPHAQLSSRPEKQEPSSPHPGPFSCRLRLDWLHRLDAQYPSFASR
jgi:hypothetical protein